MSQLHFGAAYYPEHWASERWAKDILLMQQANFTVVRMAEFAWSTLEPSAGNFNFEWLDRAIEQLAAAGIVTVLGTPTAAPPAWLVEKYPDLLAVNEHGQRVQFGNRCHYCVNSPEFHAATQRIVSAMAEHFGANANVIGWQIDNEFNRVCYCARCQRRFQEFLKTKYGTLETLNERWSTAYWSQTYSAWTQIPIPIGAHNPGLMLEFKHFVTASYRQFQKLQLDLLRPQLAPQVWITHNFMGWHGGYDHYEMAADLDMASWDWYVGSGHHDYLAWGAVHDLTRGFKQKNFWLMETQPGHVNWSQYNNFLDRGEARAMAWHAIAHGAEAVLYWQWRSAPGGQEQYHGTLIDAAGEPRPFYQEAQGLGNEMQRVSNLIADSQVRARVAMLNSYDSRWSVEFQRHHADFDYVAHFTHYYRALAAKNVSVDVISADEALEAYQLVIVPALAILNEKRTANLKNFVQRGGHVVLTIRTGIKDEYNALLLSRQPGPLAALAGVEVAEYFSLDEPVPVRGDLFDGVSAQWAEQLALRDTTAVPLARFGKSNGWLDEQTAIAAHPFGKGIVYTAGVYLDESAQQTFINYVLQRAGIQEFQAPQGVEVAQRIDAAGNVVYFVINHTAQARAFMLPWSAFDHLAGHAVRELQLEPYGVAILARAQVDTA